MFLETLAGPGLNRGPALTDIKDPRVRSGFDLDALGVAGQREAFQMPR
jgi:hypothetical protein